MAISSASRQRHTSWRNSIELTVVAIILYFFVGAPGLDLGVFYPSTQALQPSAHSKNSEDLITPAADLQCEKHRYEAHVFSTRPLVVYIDEFLSADEAEHLIHSSADRWQTSTVFNGGVETEDTSVRNSQKARLDRDHIVQCLEARALAFQGWPAHTYIEPVWTQRYNVSGHYALHYDWASGSNVARRASTFMVYIQAPELGGGTHFPKLEHPGGTSPWCDFIICDEGDDSGVVFKARDRAAVFWQNFNEDGKGYHETIHAGLPVEKGVKIGANVWSWYQTL